MKLSLKNIQLPFSINDIAFYSKPYYGIDSQSYKEGVKAKIHQIRPQIEPTYLDSQRLHLIKNNHLELFIREIEYYFLPQVKGPSGTLEYRYLILDNYENTLKAVNGAVNSEKVELVMPEMEIPFNIGDQVYAYHRNLKEHRGIEIYKGIVTYIRFIPLANINHITESTIENVVDGKYNLYISAEYTVMPLPEYYKLGAWREAYNFDPVNKYFDGAGALFSTEADAQSALEGKIK